MEKTDFVKLLEENNKKLTKKIINDFGDFIERNLFPYLEGEFEDIKGRLNDMEHLQDRMLRTLEKHEDRLERIEAKL